VKIQKKEEGRFLVEEKFQVMKKQKIKEFKNEEIIQGFRAV
jgi:hypothetical protein